MAFEYRKGTNSSQRTTERGDREAQGKVLGALSFEKKLHISVMVSELLVEHAREAASREFT